MKKDNPKLRAALSKARLADDLEREHDHNGALKLYKDAVDILISLIEGRCISYRPVSYQMFYRHQLNLLFTHLPCTTKEE